MDNSITISLYLKLGDQWCPSLAIPLSEFSHFSNSPRRWLAYLAFAVTGLVGNLRSDKDDPSSEVILDSPDPISQYSNYYYVVENDMQIAPVDPDLENTSISDSSSLSSLSGRDPMFRPRIVDRDGTCIMDGASEEDCHAAHLIRFSLGDKYIKALTTKRRFNNDPIIDDINDVRNGFLMNSALHRNFGKSIAFLRVPNPFMNIRHIPSNNTSTNLEESQYFLHDFNSVTRNTSHRQSVSPHNGRARPPQDMTTWPTSTLLDFVYGFVALKMLGCVEARDVLRKNWGSKFYSSDIGSNRDGGQHNVEMKRRQIALKKRQHDDARDTRDPLQPKFGPVEAELCVGIFSGIGLPGDVENEFHREAEFLHKKQNEEKVADWLASVQSPRLAL